LAHSASAIKRVRQNVARRLRNRSNRSRLRSQIKKLRQALETKNAAEAKKLLPETASLIDVMVKKGVIHENAGNRYKSRLASRAGSAAPSK
jgi:small subunit ribosomal protein S20